MVSLDVLDLHDNRISKIENLKNLTNLRIINLSNNLIKTLEIPYQLKFLNELNLRKNVICEVREICHLTSL